MAEAVVSFLAVKLGHLIVNERKLLSGVSHQVRLAQTELKLMQGFLKDADARQTEDETLRILVSEIRDTAYDLEDVIEAFVLKVASKRKRGLKNVINRFSCILIEGVHLHKIGSEIRNITTKFSTLRLSLQTFSIMEAREVHEGVTSSYERQQQLRRTYSHVIERDVVGFKDSIDKLVRHLVKDELCHRVVSIWGMGGSGKTTLAKQVYHHNEVRRHFGSFAWVCISQRCQVRVVWEGILVKLISATNKQRKEIAQMKDDEVAKQLYLLLQEKRCLVVLDDIWSVEAWDSLKPGFPNEETESKILLTTRRETVALHADINGFLLQPVPLNENESWELFEKIAIFGRNDIDSETRKKMKGLGEEMLRNCAGLPLAVSVLAGLLAKKNTIDEWGTVHTNVHTYIRRGKGHQEDYAGASWVLALSYDELPYHLKPCFLYLGHFPENFEISVKRLTQLWIAEGFISFPHQKQGLNETMEDVAYNCLSELVERCVVQVGERGSIRKIKTCRIHDLMRDLCLLKAEEESFLQIVDFSDRSRVIGGKVRRYAVYLGVKDEELVPSKDEKDGRLRSLLYFTSKEWLPRSEKLLKSVFQVFKLLRVLKIEDMEGEVELPTEIGNMVHLRFLSLRDSAITRLPSSLGNLIGLQTLDLHFRWSSEEIIPNVIWKMQQLRHLYLPWDYRSRTVLKLSTLHNLQTLTGVSIDDCDLGDFLKLANLRKLAIGVQARPVTNLEEILRSASSALNRIRSLFVIHYDGVNRREEVTQIILHCRHIYKLELYGPIQELPDLKYHPNLTKLTLTFCRLKDEQMAVLEKLPNLTTLVLVATFEKNAKTLVCSKGGFRRLEFLSLRYLEEIEEWRVEEGAMPALVRLQITLCYGLKTVPDELRSINTLKELAIDRMPRPFYRRLQEGGEDFDKIKHVPSLVFGGVLREQA